MKKRIFALLLAVALIFTLGAVGCSKKKTDGLVISVESVKAKAGKTVEVPVEISGNPGIMALLIGFEFDAEQLQYAGFEKGKVFSDYEIAENDGELKLMCLENEDVKGDGELVTLKFKVVGKNNAKTDVKVVIEDNSICNYDEELIKATGEDGTVKIKK